MKVLKRAILARESGHVSALCTVIGRDGSAPRHNAARMLVYGDGQIVGTVGGGAFEQKVIEEALLSILNRKNRRLAVNLSRDLGMCCGGSMEVFVEYLDVKKKVHLFGLGHVGQSVCRALVGLDFDVYAYDERPDWLEQCNQWGATLQPGNPLEVLPEVGVDDFLLIFTHSHDLDQALVEHFITKDYGFLGMIGSKTKVAKFFLRLKAAGVDTALFEKVSAPVGLDIGAETPEEIAVSIVAELVQTRAGHESLSLPLSSQRIPARGTPS